ncbi:HAMP domain-containing histidine kinase [Myxococcota bacterium]|nr:HAMP domain-containing histidine kinase [Myxococcota bacterium]
MSVERDYRLLSRTLRRRTIIGAVIGAGLATVLIVLPFTRFIFMAVANRQLEVQGIFGEEARAECAADPAGWRLSGPAWDAWAVSEAGTTPNPDAPALTATTRVELALFGSSGRLVRRWEGYGQLVRPFGEGDCAYVLYRWRASQAPLSQFTLRVLFVGLGLSLILGGLIAAYIFRPLAVGVDRLVNAAGRVGTPDFSSPVVDATLRPVGAVLEEAHRRALDEQAQARALNETLERHLDEVAHDLRTPLASLQLRLDALRRAPEPELLAAAAADVTYMVQLVGNLHQSARLDRGAARPSPVELGAVMERVAERFAALGARRGVSVMGNSPSEALYALCDEDAVEQALSNLVHNSIHHRAPGEEGGNVALTLERIGGEFTLRVADDGPGLPPGRVSALFEAPAHRARVGEGLGLSIVAAVAARFGWTLGFEPLSPQGLEVTLRGPLIREEEGASGAPQGLNTGG